MTEFDLIYLMELVSKHHLEVVAIDEISYIVALKAKLNKQLKEIRKKSVDK